MSRMNYFWDRLFKMDWKAMWKTTGILKKRSGKSRIWLLRDMLKCATKYNAGYIDYKIAQMYRLNDEQRDRAEDEPEGILAFFRRQDGIQPDLREMDPAALAAD